MTVALVQHASGGPTALMGTGPYTTAIAFPAPPAAGDLLIAAVQTQDGATITIPGWTLSESQTASSFKFHDRLLRVFTRTAAAGDPASWTLTASGAACHAHWDLTEWSGVAGWSSASATQSAVASYAKPVTAVPAGRAVAVLCAGTCMNSNTPSTTSIGYTTGTLLSSALDTVVQGGWAVAHAAVSRSTGTDSMTLDGNGGFGSPAQDTYQLATVVMWGPAPVGVWFDWTEGGFGAGAHDDCTADVESWTITRGSGPEVLDGANPGAMTLVLNSPADDRYNPRNALGPLYGKLIDGVRVWVSVDSAEGALSGTDPRGLFAGRITDITPLPMAGADAVPQVEVVCEDALGWLARRPVEVAAARDRSQAELRALVLAQAGETSTVLPAEPVRLALSSWRGSARDALEAINGATGTRHFARPSDDRDAWYDYVARDRMWGLGGVAGFTADDSSAITGTSGWRLSADTVVNRQEASVEPVAFTAGEVTVWEHPSLPFTMTAESRVLMVDFDDFVDGPVVDLNYSGAAPSTLTIEALGDAARITIATAGTMTVTRLAVIGRLARRGLAETVREDDAASQAGVRGIRAGSPISGDLLGPTAAARGLCRHVVWRHGSPQYRPQAVIEAWFPEMFEVDLYDVLDAGVAQVGAATLFEVVGLQLVGGPGLVHVLTLTLQESRVQAPTSWFKVGSSLLGGADLLPA